MAANSLTTCASRIIQLIRNNLLEINETLQKLNTSSTVVGLNVKTSKTKALQSSDKLKTKLKIGDVDFEAESYVYLGQEANMRPNPQPKNAHRKAAE